MKKISLSKGHFALIDDDDFAGVSQYKWSARTGNGKVYAIRGYSDGKKYKYQYLHRFLLNVTDRTITVDHVNGDTLDNRKKNLRIATSKQNGRNRQHKIYSKSGYRGVYLKKDYKRLDPWYARITINRKTYKHLGYFSSAKAAAKAFDKAAKEMYGEFCGKLNFS